jgi:hypothetical protein
MKRRNKGDKRHVCRDDHRIEQLHAAIEHYEKKLNDTFWAKEAEECRIKITEFNRELQRIIHG